MFLLKHLFKLREKSQGDVVKPFLDHMEDLRWTIIKIVLVLVISMVAAAWNRQDLMDLLKHPLMIADPTGELAGTIRSDSIMDSFMITLKVAFYVGIIIALPFILYFVAEFVLPALTEREKKVMLPGFLVGVVFFLMGAAASYFYITPHTLAFFWHDAQSIKLYSLWTWTNYIKFFTWLTLGFGLMCELPLLVIILSLVGVVNYKFLSTTRSYAITGIMIIACIVAPTPDPITFLTLSLPIVAMYEACIWIVWLIDRARARKAAAASIADEVTPD